MPLLGRRGAVGLASISAACLLCLTLASRAAAAPQIPAAPAWFNEATSDPFFAMTCESDFSISTQSELGTSFVRGCRSNYASASCRVIAGESRETPGGPVRVEFTYLCRLMEFAATAQCVGDQAGHSDAQSGGAFVIDRDSGGFIAAGGGPPVPLSSCRPPLDTKIGKFPKSRKARKPTFAIETNETGATVEYMVDGGNWTPCSAEWLCTVGPLSFGRHALYFRAVSAAGSPDTTPVYIPYVRPAKKHRKKHGRKHGKHKHRPSR